MKASPLNGALLASAGAGLAWYAASVPGAPGRALRWGGAALALFGLYRLGRGITDHGGVLGTVLDTVLPEAPVVERETPLEIPEAPAGSVIEFGGEFVSPRNGDTIDPGASAWTSATYQVTVELRNSRAAPRVGRVVIRTEEDYSIGADQAGREFHPVALGPWEARALTFNVPIRGGRFYFAAWVNAWLEFEEQGHATRGLDAIRFFLK